MARVLTGVQSTGIPHLGNILGAIQPGIKMSRDPKNEALFFIADLHTLTTVKDGSIIRENTYATAASWLACGFDTTQNIFYRQSDVAAQVCELTWYLNCFTPFPMLGNAHSFKDKSDRLSEVTSGLFTYPVLMTADIIGYDAELVPVGKDQQQHLEMARDIAQSINHKYGEIFVLPEGTYDSAVMVVPGTDGQKMSKSYGNAITFFQNDKQLRKEVMKIITDSKGLEEVKDPDTCNAFAIYKLLANADQISQMRANYAGGNYGYGHAKQELFELICEKFKTERHNFDSLMNDKGQLDKELALGAEKARDIISEVLKRFRPHIGY